MLVATHQLDRFEGRADRITVIENGVVVHDGPAEGGTREHYLEAIRDGELTAD